MCERGVVVIFIEDGDEGRAGGAAGGGTAVLNQHRQLVTGLLLSVQNGPSADLTWGQKQMGKPTGQRQTSTIEFVRILLYTNSLSETFFFFKMA